MAAAFEELAIEFDLDRSLFIGEACRTLVDEYIVVTWSEPTKS